MKNSALEVLLLRLQTRIEKRERLDCDYLEDLTLHELFVLLHVLARLLECDKNDAYLFQSLMETVQHLRRVY